MKQTWRVVCALVLVVAAVGVPAPIGGQQPLSQTAAAAGATLQPWASRVDAMLRDGTLVVDRVQADTLLPGRRHERLSQQHAGLPVFGGELVRQLAGTTVVSVFGRTFEAVSLPSAEPTITAETAMAIAQAAAGPGAVAEPPRLGILPVADAYVLVWRTKVRSAWNVRVYDVNAGTGLVERDVSGIQFQDEAVVGLGTGVLGDRKKVSAIGSGSSFEAIDLLRPAVAFTLTFAGSVNRFNGFLTTGNVFFSDVATSTTNNWSDGPVVDAHVYQGWTYDYYFKRFGRRGVDDQDLGIISIVHPLTPAGFYTPDVVGQWINNAAYLGDGFVLYGDGDGVLFRPLSGGFDVVAHELTHGVTEFTSNLEYRDEPGALNEAFSDIMATGAEFMLLKAGAGPQKGPNWVIGEDVTKVSPGFIRSLQAPIQAGYPDHYSLRQYIGTNIDEGGVHVNSTIVSHAFYLAVAGGTNRVSGLSVAGVGVANISRMERIFYRAFTTMLGPTANFSAARAATLQAATDLFGAGSADRAQLLQAWNAVGVQ